MKAGELAGAALDSARTWIVRRGAAGLTAAEAAAVALAPRPERAAASEDVAAARFVFERLIALEAAYDPALAALYSDDGLVIERIVQNGRERRRREIPMRRYRAALPYALLLSSRAKERSAHADMALQRIAPGWVSLRSQRTSTQSRAPGPYEMIVRKESDGAWRIVKETATLVL